ncbi:hypothetical protein [Nocardiopsis sp. M1B1]|uniref:hypothetical protein n=1 Tax=Nocardiopsis sp. M1B1 TaxID=3450454 RepID=UPI004039547F
MRPVHTQRALQASASSHPHNHGAGDPHPMQPERPPLRPLVGLIVVFASHVVLVVTPTAFGGKPYGTTVAWAIIVVFAVVVYRKLWARYRAYQEHSPSEEEPEP